MSFNRIVVAEDETPIRELLVHHLAREGFACVEAADGPTALRAARSSADLVILDIGLPVMDGFDVIRTLRREGRMLPVLVLTARADEIDRVVGLEIGADDYVTKPFSPRELVARVKAILRRSDGGTQERSEVLVAGRVEVDVLRREARVDGEVVQLASKEFQLLQFLAERPGRALSRQQLLDGVWGQGWYGDDRTVDAHVRQLRKKLGDALPLSTVWGMGYRLG
jgi:two-component system alkaline phosphatase synthesis response regulator PhoP